MRGEGQGAQACSSARSFHLARAAEVLGAKRVALRGLRGGYNVRTGTALSSLGCWLFILSAVAWPEVGVRSASRTQAAARQLWGKVACATGVSEARRPCGMAFGRSTHTLVIEV